MSVIATPIASLLRNGIYRHLLTNDSTKCLHGQEWIYTHFHECITTDVEKVGFALGIISLACWIIVFLPQYYESCKSGKMDEGVSFLFLLSWMFGDITNLIGCLLTHQLVVQLAIAIYYCFNDVLIIVQYLYYYTKNRSRHTNKKAASAKDDTTPSRRGGVQAVYCVTCLGCVSMLYLLPWQPKGVGSHSYQLQSYSTGRVLLHSPLFTSTEDIVGYSIGVLCGIFYLAARVPQIIKNFQRKSVEGVSVLMFILSIIANSTYGASILMEGQSYFPYKDWVIKHLPWLIGSLGTLAFDTMLILQFVVYGKDNKSQEQQETGLLVEDERTPLLNDLANNH